MKAILFSRTGLPEEVLSLGTALEPTPAPDQVLIRVTTRSIQPADLLFIEGRYRYTPSFPQIAGFDAVGTVIDTGPGVTDLAQGTRVAFRGVGAWAEMAVASRSRVYPVPEALSDDVASQFALNPLTAWGLIDECRLAPGARLLITAGRSIVASLLTLLARRQGLNPVLLIRNEDGYVTVDGNDGSVIAHAASVAQVLQGTLKGEGFNAVLDAVGGVDSLALIDALLPGGRLVTYGLLSDTDITLKGSTLLRKNLIWQGFGIEKWVSEKTPEDMHEATRELWAVLAEHPHVMPVIGRFPLERFQEALQAVRNATRPGKVLLTN
ncbi:zinc-dependent alcohol dehydrogenase family protein [Mangrovitalea sediminis]|uniref:zinc-dependent alcohol dehydrogenase family protein n=1 Tax=Mangrovitalea sediminis TaxID=1982043 RepID=UPI000BE5CCFD|nr:zinc-dependent alcohol dehydrogenase family protein [Mangrovitalea sediminis]